MQAIGDNPTDADATLGALGLTEGCEIWRATWPLSAESFAASCLEFLEPEHVRRACGSIGMSEDVTRAILAGLEPLRRAPELRRLAWHCHWLLFRSTAEHAASVSGWPSVAGKLGADAAMFYAIVLLSGLDKLRGEHRRRGIPEAVTAETLWDLELWIREYRRRHGAWGFDETRWLARHFACRVVKLGRLQYEAGRFGPDFSVYRHRTGGRVVMLAGPGMTFRADGQFDGSDGRHDPAAAWAAEFADEGATIRGRAIRPEGKADPTEIALPSADWQSVLRKDDPVFNIHIPAGEKMDFDACGESLRTAAARLPEYFPEHRPKAFVCRTWLLDSQLEAYLPADSNIVRFLREFYLFPLPYADDSQTLERVFGRRDIDVDAAPTQTALQKAIVRHMKGGGRWRTAGGFLLPDDLDWGSQVYRTRLRFGQ